ncbi:MAG: 5' nucleotidase, NT5C type [Nitrosopumilus sp.]|jgi:uncharacterized HAD superfamily protein
MKIALDVDGVLADVIVSWIEINNQNRTKISKNDVTSWDFWKQFNIDRFDFYSELSKCWENWNEIPPTEKNLQQSTKLLNQNATVDIVTAREQYTDTFVKNWLNHFNISYDNYVSVIDGTMKADLDYDLFIDDSPLNAEKFTLKNKKFLLYNQPWNQNIQLKNVNRISNLFDVVKLIF